MVRRAILCLALLLAGCGPRAVTLEEYNTRVVTLPDGYKVRCEVMATPQDMARGMMFRDSLAEDRGMLFLHNQPGPYRYWMYNVRIPLDMIWMDANRRIVELAADAQPCTEEDPNRCRAYGGAAMAIIVLELPAGSIEKHGLKVGQQLRF